jgi:outer membrane protein insertion porin family
MKRDINAVYSTGLFEDVNASTREADDSTEAAPKVRSARGLGTCIGKASSAAGAVHAAGC